MKKAILLFSGGIDSTVALWKMLSEGWRVYLLNINYHRRNPKEIEAAMKIAAMCRNEGMITINLPFLREIYDYEEPVKAKLMQKLKNPPTIMAPFRNIILYSIAAHVATQLEVETIAGGHIREDTEILQDATPEYIETLNKTLKQSLDIEETPKITTPLINLTKPQVIQLGTKLKAPLEKTWSCWASGPGHCGKCPGCQKRKQAYQQAGQKDPTTYLEHQNIWKP